MMAAAVAASRGRKVLLLEKNPQLGEKLKISGGGRCNITNAEEDVRKLLAKYGDAEQFLYSAFSQFGMKDTFTFFEERNLPLVVEARKRAFPASQKASDVFRTLLKYIEEGKVTILPKTKVSRIIAEGKRVVGVRAGQTTYTADSYILATGGTSRPETGSTGDGFGWLKALGHTVAAASPNIVPLKVRETWVRELSGVSLSFMKITFFAEGKKAFSEKGKLLFTHFGLSGPLILNASRRVSDLLEGGRVTAYIDCFPDTDEGTLEARILGVFDIHKNKMLKNVFDEIAPHGMHATLLTRVLNMDPDTKVHSVTKEDRKQMVQTLKALPLTITDLMGFDRAVVANGGVSLLDVDMRTMRSRHFENLYITGDLLDITRPSGGYSLQLCWTTGFVAGTNA